MENHNIVHHKLDAIKAIKSGWKHIMRSPWTYVGCTIIFLCVSAIIGSINTSSIILDNLVTYALDAFVTMIVIKLLLDKYESRKVNINFSFMDYLHFLAVQLILGLGFLLLLAALTLPTFYPIYKVAVTEKQAFWGDVKTSLVEDNITNKDLNLMQYVDITGDEVIVFSLLALFLIGFCAIIYLVFRVSMTQWFLIDKRYGPINAIKHSWHITRGNVTQMSILAMLSVVIMFVGVLALFVGVLFAMPLAYLINLDSYKQMIGENK